MDILGGIGLITNQEIENSNISQEKSEEFMKHEMEEDIASDIIDDDPVSVFLLI